MALKTRAQCTPSEALNYLNDYFATVDLTAEALEKYEMLASDAPTASERSRFRAKALEAERDLELLKNKRRAFNNGAGSINPPSDATVKQAEQFAQDLAKILAKSANATAIIDLATKGLAAFNNIHPG